MDWTEKKPEDDGYYWWRINAKVEGRIIQLKAGNCQLIGDTIREPIANISGEWSDVAIPAPAASDPTAEVKSAAKPDV